MNLAAIFMILVALLIQGWLSIFQLATDDITIVYTGLLDVSLIILIPASVFLVSSNINWLFSIHHRINYVIAIPSLVGFCLFIIFRVSLENLLFPRTMILYLLILDFLWTFFLGLLMNRFRKTANKTSTD
jgi:hypothetical protein